MGDSIAVPFRGDGAGEGPLAWGQLQCWRTMVEVGTSLPLGRLMPFPAGMKVDALVDVLRFWLERYASLRTTVRVPGPTQVVHGSGVLDLVLVDAGADALATAEDLLARWKAEPFDYEKEWPIRAGAVMRDGVATHAVIVVCHLAADGAGIAVMGRDLDAPSAPPGPQPLDLAAAQRGPAAQRQSAASLRFWETQVRGLTPYRLGPPVDRGAPRYRRVLVESAGLRRGLLATAAELRLDPAPVLMAVFARALRRVCGTDPFVAQVIVGNRFRPGLADAVTPLVQNGLAVFEVGDAPLAELAARAVKATVRASKYAYYDPTEWTALLDRLPPVDLGVFWNDRRTDTTGPTTGTDRVLLDEPMPYFNEQLMVNVDDAPGTLHLLTEFDTHHLSSEDLRRIVAEMTDAVS
jgi:hypothetical protein